MQPVDSNRPVVVHEPYALKGARTVLRGERGSNAALLPSKSAARSRTPTIRHHRWTWPLCLAASVTVLATSGHAQTAPSAEMAAADTAAPETSALDGELFYQLLLGELNVRGDDPGAGYSLFLDAARRTQSAQLYRRAVDIALQARSGDAALTAADAWALAFDRSSEPLRFKLQILLALNRVADTPPVLKKLVALGSADKRDELILSIPQTFGRTADRGRAAGAVREALKEELAGGPNAAAAWATVGRMELAAGRTAEALTAAQRAQAASVRSRHSAVLALELMEDGPGRGSAETLVQRYLAVARNGDTPVQLAYARVLLELQRPGEALRQVEEVVALADAPAEAWLLLGTTHARANRDTPARAALERYLQKTEGNDSDVTARGRTQAFLLLAQLAEKAQDYTGANAWLDRIENPQEVVAAQMRRASILARQGQVDQARALLRATPERLPSDARTKLVAEAQLLRDLKRYAEAFEVYSRAIERFPDDLDLVYEQAMMAERAGRFDEMERLLRGLIDKQPDSAQAYNALGYALADRNERLPEAKALIEQALKHSPDDAYIQDSLAWVEFRLGNRAEALRLLQAAYAKRPDVEIAAHLGEVLWVHGERDKAIAIWREGLLLSNDNEVLLETMKRFQVQP